MNYNSFNNVLFESKAYRNLLKKSALTIRARDGAGGAPGKNLSLLDRKLIRKGIRDEMESRRGQLEFVKGLRKEFGKGNWFYDDKGFYPSMIKKGKLLRQSR